MCGIGGMVFQDHTRPIDPSILKRMSDALRHRGPDDCGHWSAAGAGLIHRRLSILDLSPAGHQPMTNEDGSVWMVFNGEIYNFLELRAQLEARGHVFRSRTDSEVIIHLYEDFGPSCVEHLHGMFAIAIWDTPRRRLVLARDRVGKKPLKYAETGGGIVFASELKSILASGLVPAEVDASAIDEFLSFGYVPDEGTGFATIRKLPPAHVLVWENGAATLKRYWRLDFRQKLDLPIPEWKDRVRAQVKEAVTKRLVSDVPLGAFLSGGIDSSIVVACMAEAQSRVETFSIGFEEEEFNELPHARLVAQTFGTTHHEFIVKADAAEHMALLAAAYEEPYADPSALPSYILARETRKHVSVALNGDGGDEGFAGYERYASLQDRIGRSTWPRRLGVRGLARAALRSRGLSPNLERRLDGVQQVLHPDPGVGYGWMMRLFSDREKAWFWQESARRDSPVSCLDRIARLMNEPAAGTSLVDKMLYADTASYLPDDLLVKMDIASMAHGLEARSPLLDHHLLELAASAPASLKCRRGSLKWLLKETFRETLPDVIFGRTKMGFGIPLNDWFRGPLLQMTRDLLVGHGARVHRYLRRDALATAVDQHASRAFSRGHQLWALVMLELWLRETVDVARPRP